MFPYAPSCASLCILLHLSLCDGRQELEVRRRPHATKEMMQPLSCLPCIVISLVAHRSAALLSETVVAADKVSHGLQLQPLWIIPTAAAVS